MDSKILKDIERMMGFAREELKNDDLTMALNFSDNAIRDIVLLDLSDLAVIEKLVHANPTKSQSLTIEAIITLGTTFALKALKLKQLGHNVDYQFVWESFIAAESYLWIAAKVQIEIGDIVSLTATTIGICDLHYEKGIYSSETTKLLQYNDFLISQIEQSGRFDKNIVDTLRKMNEKVVKKLFRKSSKEIKR